MISYPVTCGQYSLNFKLKTNSEQTENDISVLAARLAMTQQTINSTQGHLSLKARPGKGTRAGEVHRQQRLARAHCPAYSADVPTRPRNYSQNDLEIEIKISYEGSRPKKFQTESCC